MGKLYYREMNPDCLSGINPHDRTQGHEINNTVIVLLPNMSTDISTTDNRTTRWKTITSTTKMASLKKFFFCRWWRMVFAVMLMRKCDELSNAGFVSQLVSSLLVISWKHKSNSSRAHVAMRALNFTSTLILSSSLEDGNMLIFFPHHARML